MKGRSGPSPADGVGQARRQIPDTPPVRPPPRLEFRRGTAVAPTRASAVRLTDLRRVRRAAGRKVTKEDVVVQWCVERVARAVVFGAVGLLLGSRA